MKITPNTTCAYTIPTYLEPIPPKLGKVSVKEKAEKKAKPLSSRQKDLPSFLNTLESQYAPSLALNNYLGKTFPGLKNPGDVGSRGGGDWTREHGRDHGGCSRGGRRG